MPAKHHQETQSAANQAKRIPRLSAGGPELFRGEHTCHRHTDSGCACSAADDRSPPYSRKLREFHTKLGVLSRRWRPSSRTAGPNRDPSPILDASWLRSVSCATGLTLGHKALIRLRATCNASPTPTRVKLATQAPGPEVS